MPAGPDLDISRPGRYAATVAAAPAGPGLDPLRYRLPDLRPRLLAGRT
jgi:hypothetical protein